MNKDPILAPEVLEEVGTFLQPSESDLVFKSTNCKIPKFNATIYFENKQQVGVLDEIFGPLNEVYFLVKPKAGILPSSFKAGDKVFIATDRLMPFTLFEEQPTASKKSADLKLVKKSKSLGKQACLQGVKRSGNRGLGSVNTRVIRHGNRSGFKGGFRNGFRNHAARGGHTKGRRVLVSGGRPRNRTRT